MPTPGLSVNPAALALVAAVLFSVDVALAEAPMNTDDAGTLDRGGMKVETIWARDAKTKGVEALFGFGLVENLEMEVGAARARDSNADQSARTRGISFGVKWLPYQNNTGWSLGAGFHYHRTHVDDRDVSEAFTECRYTLAGLASYRRENGQVLHVNLGTLRAEAPGKADTAGVWGIGYEFPIVDRLQLTAEVFGEEHSRPDKAIGLRYELFDGLKISGAFGRGNDRSFGQVGAAWEF